MSNTYKNIVFDLRLTFVTLRGRWLADIPELLQIHTAYSTVAAVLTEVHVPLLKEKH